MPRPTLVDTVPPSRSFQLGAFALDRAAESRRIETGMGRIVVRDLKRRGIVVGVSGGIDSAVCVTLAVRAMGQARVLALLMPEREGSDDGMERAKRLCERLGVTYLVENIGPALEAIGCYRQRDAAIRTIVPEYRAEWRHKIVVSGMQAGRLPHFYLVVEDLDGTCRKLRLPHDPYLQIVAATNYKQRVRKALEYYHAERLNYAVLGTPNKLEYELGFFVRGGDGLADLKPIANLYKTQVYDLAEYLGVPDEIRSQPPSTDTYSLPQTQEEFYFALPYGEADLLLYAMHHGIDMGAVGLVLGLDPEQMQQAAADFAAKRRSAHRTLRDAILVDGHRPIEVVQNVSP